MQFQQLSLRKFLSSICNSSKKVKSSSIIAVFFLSFFVFTMFVNQPLIHTIKAEAAIMKLDNAVDSDSDVDSVPNIGINDSSYINAQSLDGTDQVIQEAGGYDFKTIHGTTVITGTSATITEGVDYTLEAGVTIYDAFIRITGAWNQAQGQTSGGASQAWNQFSAHIDNPEQLLTSIDFVRLSSTSDTRITWEIIQYIGENGGANEIIVRYVADDISASGTQDDGSTITTISDIDKTIAFLTGQSCSASGIWPPAQGYGTLEFVADGADWQVRGTRGITNNNWQASYAVVEFTGSNWRDVQRVEFSSNDHGATLWTTGSPDNSGTYSIPTELLDVSKAFLHVQFRHLLDWSLSMDSFFSNIELTSSTTNFRTRRTSSYADANAIFVVWVMENTQTGSGEMIVEHIAGYRSDTTGTEEKVYYHTITTVLDINQTAIMGESSSTVDTTYNNIPTGIISMQLTENDNVTLRATELDFEERYSFDVVQFPTVSAGGGGSSLMSSKQACMSIQQAGSSGSYYYYEIMPQRGQTYRHFYNSTSDLSQNRYTFQSDNLVYKENLFPSTNWVTFEEYPLRFILRLNNGTVKFFETPDEITNYILLIVNSTIWAVGIESFIGVLAFYMDFSNPNGHSQYLFYPRLKNGSLPAYNMPLYAIFSHLYAKIGVTVYDAILNNKTLYSGAQNPRNHLHFTNNSDTLGFYFNVDGLNVLNTNWDFLHGLKFNTTDKVFHLKTDFRCTSRGFDDIGMAYEITSSPQSDGTPYQPAEFIIFNETHSVQLNTSQAWQAGVYLQDFYSDIEIISENGESFRFTFQDMEAAGFTAKYLDLHDQAIPNLGVRKTLRAGMYGFGSYSQNAWIYIDPSFSAKQSNSALDFSVRDDGLFYDIDTMRSGYTTAREYRAFIAFETGIVNTLETIENGTMTFWPDYESVEAGEYHLFGLYNKTDADGIWNTTEGDADESSAYAQSMFWSNSSFYAFDGTTDTNVTITSASVDPLLLSWKGHHNLQVNRSAIGIKIQAGTNTDSATDDYFDPRAANTATVSRRPSLSFDYVYPLIDTTYRLEWEHQADNIPYTTMDSFNLTIYGNSSDSEDYEIQLWNITASDWINTSQFIEQSETWYNFSIDDYEGVIDSNITWRYLDNITSSDTTQGSLRIDYAGIVYWNYSINLIEATLSLPNYDATLDGWQNYIENPLEINISSLYNFDVEVRGTDGVGNPVSNSYIRFDIDSNPAGGTNLTTSYQVLYNDQTAGEDLQLTFWLFFAYPRLGGNEGTTFTMTLYIRIINA